MKKIISVTAAASLLLCAVICAAAFLLGDANGDGDINNKDVVALFRKLSEMQTTETDEPGMINDETDSEDSGSFNDMFG